MINRPRLAVTALLVAIPVLFVSWGGSQSQAAEVKRCQPVVKKIFLEPDFYKATVLIVHGRVGCGEARKVLWRSLRPAGYFGRIRGWDCEGKGTLAAMAEKCTRESQGQREVIKSGRPKICRTCHANRN